MEEYTSAPATHTANEHGSIRSYVIGFILSILFTIIPYLLVTRHILSGNTLLLSLLGIAVIQMFVQIFFFLHLGRGPKPLYNVVFFTATASFIVLIIGASLFIMNNLYRNMSPQEVTVRIAQNENLAEVGGIETGACQGNNANHIVSINDIQITPEVIIVKRCDTISFVSDDNTEREIIFFADNDQVSYGGMYEVQVRPDRSQVITMNEVGEFNFQDAGSIDAPRATFIVEP